MRERGRMVNLHELCARAGIRTCETPPPLPTHPDVDIVNIGQWMDNTVI